MTNKDIQIIKNEILHYLCDDFERNQALFNRRNGHEIFRETDLTMVMDKVVGGLKSAQIQLNK